jgi:hypothetical protein
MPKERRHAPRHHVERLATMVSPGGAARYCIATEMSDGGIRVRANGYRVPDEFALRFSSTEPTKSYRVIWRMDLDVGAKELSTAPSGQNQQSQGA